MSYRREIPPFREINESIRDVLATGFRFIAPKQMFASKISTIYGVMSSVINNPISAFRIDPREREEKGGERRRKERKSEEREEMKDKCHSTGRYARPLPIFNETRWKASGTHGKIMRIASGRRV